jgi:hypothetical protein
MPTKGIQFYIYISNPSITVSIQIGSEYSTSFSYIPNTVSNPAASYAIQQGSFEIGSTTIGLFSEIFSCFINDNSNGTPNSIFQLNQSMSPLTGGVRTDSDDDLWNMMNTSSISIPDTNFVVSYGFYQASMFGMHQFYIYVTENFSNWMTNLNSVYSSKFQNTSPVFSSFILPGAHDSGMTANAIVPVIDTGSQIFKSICNNYGLPFNDTIFTAQLAFQTITNFAFTQKDTITTLLNIGIRFFDFRPGLCYGASAENNTIYDLYHQHYCVPGYSFVSFLTDIINWLNNDNNRGEIVVVYLNFHGFISDSMKPLSLLADFFNPANSSGGNNICSLLEGSTLQVTGANSLGSTYEELINSNSRLIFVNNFGEDFGSTPPNYLFSTSYIDSYADAAYEQDEVGPILNQLSNTINTASTSQNANILLQLQGTATGTILGMVNSLSSSACSSQLMSTKPSFDAQTYKFLTESSSLGVLSNVGNNNFFACINDFADNALVSNCIFLTQNALKLSQY